MRKIIEKVPYNNVRKPIDIKGRFLLILFLTMIMSGINIASAFFHIQHFGIPKPFTQLNSVTEVALISILASVSEEVLFRYIIITAIMYIFVVLSENDYISLSYKSMWLISLIASSLLFMLIHPTQAFIITFIFGLLLGYIFIRYGLIEVMVIHFLTNVITFSSFIIF